MLKGKDSGGDNIKWLLSNYPDLISKSTDGGQMYNLVEKNRSYDSSKIYVSTIQTFMKHFMKSLAETGKEVV